MFNYLKDERYTFGVCLDEAQLQEFEIYRDELKVWNEKFNITNITADDEIEIKHFLDSLSLFQTGLIQGPKRLMDVGTGGGFPGIPCKIANPQLSVTLLDSLNKRIVFLDHMVDTLMLHDVETIHGRAEELGRKKDYREQYDIVTSRAVASLDTLCEYCLPFVKVGGYFIAMKGSKADEELAEGKKAIAVLGGEYVETSEVALPELEWTPHLIVIKKVKSTPKTYPRSGGKPKSKPL